MRVVTWNVLHRIHAANWDELSIASHPVEATRIAAIARRIAELGSDVCCLQEVSGDQLASLRRELPDHALHVHTYPRVPTPFRPGPGAPSLADPTEHLVTITRRAARSSRSDTFPTDRGKGFLLVELADGLAVINTHVSSGEHHAAQCAQLAAIARAHAAVVLVGDFNAARARCCEHLGAGFAAAVPVVERPTRPRPAASGKSDVIDHVFAAGCAATAVEVLAGNGLSDHNPVMATIVR